MPNEEAIIDSDRKVFAALTERGDPLLVAREMKHWAYFSSRFGAEMFAEWLAGEGLDGIDVAELRAAVDAEHERIYGPPGPP